MHIAAIIEPQGELQQQLLVGFLFLAFMVELGQNNLEMLGKFPEKGLEILLFHGFEDDLHAFDLDLIGCLERVEEILILEYSVDQLPEFATLGV